MRVEQEEMPREGVPCASRPGTLPASDAEQERKADTCTHHQGPQSLPQACLLPVPNHPFLSPRYAPVAPMSNGVAPRAKLPY